MGFFNNLWGMRRLSQSGNVMLAMFAAVGMIGVVGATGVNVIKGPVRTMHNVTQRTIAENNMIASAKLSIMAAATQGDCDGDGMIEPVAWTNTGTGPKPSGGGYLPSSLGASLQDPWGNTYGYCVWDHGSAIKKTTPSPTCATPADRLSGIATSIGPVVAVLSSGPDRVFQTSCANGPSYVTKPANSDDIVMIYTYAEAEAQSGGLWNLKAGDGNTAQIGKNLEVKNASDNVVFKVDSTTDASKPSITADYLKALSQPQIEAVSPMRLSGLNMVLDLLSGTSTSAYTASIGVNNDGVNFGNNSTARGFNFKNTNGTLMSISPTGAVTAPSFGGNGSALTNLNAANLSSGTVPTGRLGSGTANSTTFLRGDGTWSPENDPQVGTLTNGKFCTSDGTSVNCNADETDPQVTTLTNGRWCRTDGASVICDQNPPLMSYTETDPQVSTLTNGRWCRTDGTSVICDQTAPLASYTETDPEVSTLQNGRWCRSDGSSVICDQTAPLVSYTETDPQVGGLTNGRWCRTDGSSVICDQNVPLMSYTESDPEVAAVTNGQWCRGTGSQITCD